MRASVSRLCPAQTGRCTLTIEVLYEKDLRPYKYRILISSRHDRLLGELSQRFGVDKQSLRKWVIEHFDMQLLENLPARYEAGLMEGGADPLAKALGTALFTRYIPFLDEASMAAILTEVRETIRQGESQEIALQRGNTRIREALTG